MYYKTPLGKIREEFCYVYSVLFLDDGYFVRAVGAADRVSAIVGENNLSACFDRDFGLVLEIAYYDKALALISTGKDKVAVLLL